jgi:ribonuclease P protein component
MNVGPRNTLGRAEKLKSRKQTELLFAGGKAFTAFPIRVVYRIVDSLQMTDDRDRVTGDVTKAIGMEVTGKDSEGELAKAAAVQIGVSASSRHFKKATDRNRIKRLLREAYRLQKHPLMQAAQQKGVTLQVFFLYIDKTLPTFALVEDKMRYCLKRLRKVVEEQV